MSAKLRTMPKDLVLSVPLARRHGAKARGLPRTVPAVRIPLCFSAISRTCWRREWDSNPRYDSSPYTHFPGVRLQPLGHPSAMRRDPLVRSSAGTVTKSTAGCNAVAAASKKRRAGPAPLGPWRRRYSSRYSSRGEAARLEPRCRPRVAPNSASREGRP